MLLTSYVFLYGFLPLFLGAYYLLPKAWRSWVIAAASYIFYGWWRPDFVLLMWVSTVVDYSCGKGIGRDRGRGDSGRRFVVLSCISNLGLLAYFKYANFGIESLNSILASMGQDSISWTAVVLPVGISFYTFQTLSYTIDVFRGDAEPASSFRDFACYVSMFPQLVAGPIVRYRSVEGQLRERTHTLQKSAIGVLIFHAGMAKKILLADTFAVAADAGFGASSLSTVEAWVAALSYTFQIYFDFSGYSDMAIGLGLLIGFQFPVNFNRPYISRSISEFWRRWHISLSSFLRDYLYVPLGGNRKGSVRTYVNLALTMLLGGLWHGAAWTFVAWGAYQGFWLILERLSGKRTLLGVLPGFAQNLVTFVLVIFGWVLFRAESMGDAMRIFGTMFGVSDGATAGLFAEWNLLQSITFVVGPLVVWKFRTTQEHAASPRAWWVATVFVLFLVSLLHLHRADNIPFLYFQF